MKFLNENQRDALKERLAQIRYDGIFGDYGLLRDYAWNGVTVQGLDDMTDEELMDELVNSVGDDEDEMVVTVLTEFNAHKMIAE